MTGCDDDFEIPWFCCLIWRFGLFGEEVFVVYSINYGKNEMMQEADSKVRACCFETSCQGLFLGWKWKISCNKKNQPVYFPHWSRDRQIKSHGCFALLIFTTHPVGGEGSWNRDLKHQIVTEVIQFHWCVSSWKAQDLYSNMMYYVHNVHRNTICATVVLIHLDASTNTQ